MDSADKVVETMGKTVGAREYFRAPDANGKIMHLALDVGGVPMYVEEIGHKVYKGSDKVRSSYKTISLLYVLRGLNLCRIDPRRFFRHSDRMFRMSKRTNIIFIYLFRNDLLSTYKLTRNKKQPP